MLSHHTETVQRTTDHFAAQPGVIGVLLAGALAHGYETPASDVDVMIVVSDAEHRERTKQGTNRFLSPEPGGRVDGTYTSIAFLDEVEERGSEPARFAFQDARVLFARDTSLVGRIASIARYPVEEKAGRLERFQAQFEAWHRYCGQALAQNNLTFLRIAVGKLVLFGGRIVLAQNETLYPSYPWFLRVLEAVPHQPPGLLAQIQGLALDPTQETIDQFDRTIRAFRPWEITSATWPAQFAADSETHWLRHPAPVDDI